MSQEERLASIIGLLEFVPSGRAIVTMKGRRLLSVDADEKTLEVEAGGINEAGLRLTNLVRPQGGQSNLLEGSRHVIGVLSRLGWKLTLYAEGDRLLTMGSGVSRLTGRVSVSPLKLKKLLDVLR